jgi:hypothetical protein
MVCRCYEVFSLPINRWNTMPLQLTVKWILLTVFSADYDNTFWSQVDNFNKRLGWTLNKCVKNYKYLYTVNKFGLPWYSKMPLNFNGQSSVLTVFPNTINTKNIHMPAVADYAVCRLHSLLRC